MVKNKSFENGAFVHDWTRRAVLLSVLTIAADQTDPAQAAVLWMDQARRLQEVSATLLDTMPVALPMSSGLQLGLRADVSFLPEPNPRVGSKLEGLPSSPVQSIPSAFGSAGLPLGASESAGAELWVGYLPKGVEKMMGISASLQQVQWGARAELASARLGAARMVVGGGVAQTRSLLVGKISSQTATDSFTSTSMLSFAHLGLQHVRSGVWGSLMVGRKKTTSRLAISDDNTDLEIVDDLSGAKHPRWIQVSVGFSLFSSLSLAVSELMVPDRLDMPRISITWHALNPSGSRRE